MSPRQVPGPLTSITNPDMFMHIFEQGGLIKTGLEDFDRGFINTCMPPQGKLCQ